MRRNLKRGPGSSFNSCTNISNPTASLNAGKMSGLEMDEPYNVENYNIFYLVTEQNNLETLLKHRMHCAVKLLWRFKKRLEGSQTMLVSRLPDGVNNVSKCIFDFLGLKEFEHYLHKEGQSRLIFQHILYPEAYIVQCDSFIFFLGSHC